MCHKASKNLRQTPEYEEACEVYKSSSITSIINNIIDVIFVRYSPYSLGDMDLWRGESRMSIKTLSVSLFSVSSCQ